jgi:monofunctional biosynthetic peptidoglycan transglycosylase
MITFGIVELSLPNLDSIKYGVVINVPGHGKTFKKMYISPSMADFVFSDSLPRHVAGAIITSEDEDFYTHHGVSLSETMEALKFDITHFTLKHGGSTITQQLVKNIFLNNKRSLTRKFVEAVIAVKLEKKLTKKQILDYYINIVEFGRGIYGIRQAAYYYFNKSPNELTPREAAMLAVIMPKPKSRGQALIDNGMEAFQKKRVANLLWRMKENGYIKSDGA